MEDTLSELKAVHSSSLIIILFATDFRVYDEDAKLIEYISNFISNCNVLTFKIKNLNEIEKILKKKMINYVILDKENNYKIHDYYYSEKNNYRKYIRLCKKYNIFRRYLVYFYNFIFGIPFNRYR